LEKQIIVLTVPASFDDVARNLTLQAAQNAGLVHVTLLEEPQAAFYCWLTLHPGQEIQQLQPGMLCLVVDVGGGTTDFSLIRVGEHSGELAFLREAVGDHLLLGGDNMDLALAKAVEAKLPRAGRLDAAQYGMLVQACREAKEALLSSDPPISFPVTIMGRGRSVVASAMHTELTRDEVTQVLFEGFFPQTPRDVVPQRGTRMGLHEMGLPYVSDPAITRHLAAFLNAHSQSPPDAILFNGGVFQPPALQQRLLDVMRDWYGENWKPLRLTNPSLDLAVAWGASAYAWLRYTGGRRVGGGTARSYYIGIETTPSDSGNHGVTAPPAKSSQSIHVLCVVPQGLSEGSEIELHEPVLQLALGQPVQFPLYTSTVRPHDRPGQVLELSPNQLLRLPPLQTVLRGGKRSAGTKQVPVTLSAKNTEIGTLELFCVARDGNNRWRLEFNVRALVQTPAENAHETAASDQVADVWPETLVQEAGRLIRGTFSMTGEPDPAPGELTKALEAVLEASRDRWPMSLCRRLWDFLSEVAESRRRSPQLASRWYHLTGFCLRPGYGDSLDRFRVEQLWKLLHAPRKETGGKSGPSMLEAGADVWIMWRRVAGGLNGSLQHSLFDRLRTVLLPRGKLFIQPAANELAEMWRAAASLERIDVKHKQALAEALLKQVTLSPVPTYCFWALTRLGARQLLYGPMNLVLHPHLIENWLDTLISFQPANDSERLSWCYCLAQWARRTGQRAIDIGAPQSQRVVEILRTHQAPEDWIRMVAEVVDLQSEDRSRMFGESLPIGLRLAHLPR
jgi:hypothetical protein